MPNTPTAKFAEYRYLQKNGGITTLRAIVLNVDMRWTYPVRWSLAVHPFRVWS